MRRSFSCVLVFLLLTSLVCLSQQSEVLEFNVIAGPSYLHTPSLNLAQRGFNGDFARNVRPWLSIGFDFSTFTGDSSLLPKYLSPGMQAKLAALPPAYQAVVAGGIRYSSSTYTYQFGPQFNYRKFRKVTPFVRPALGLLHTKIQTYPSLAGAPIVQGLLGGKLSDADTSVFYGFGGGATWEINPHFGLRFTTDLARYNFFGQQLNGPRNSVRFSVTSKFGFGRDILRK